MFLPLSSIVIILASCCRTSYGEQQLRSQRPELDNTEGSTPTTTVSSRDFPRILTVLTTYKARTQYIKAYREVARDRADGYQPMIFVTSDEEDADPDGVIDYKFGQPEVHRLLAAVREAISRYSGQFDWIAAGDDDTIFMYKRAMALLRNIDHTQPIAIGLVHGSCDLDGHLRGRCRCFTPEERIGEFAFQNATRGCCLDITRPCEVPKLPDPRSSDFSANGFGRHGVGAYEGNLYWPYGGSGFFISAGLGEAIQANNDGWEVCRNMFQASNTDIQVGKCLISNGFTFSTFSDAFLRPRKGSQETLRDQVASKCQIIGVHAGIRHIRGDTEYTPDDFKATLSKTWAEDDAQPGIKGSSLKSECPETWATITRWM